MLDKKPLNLIMGRMHNTIVRVLCNFIIAFYKVVLWLKAYSLSFKNSLKYLPDTS